MRKLTTMLLAIVVLSAFSLAQTVQGTKVYEAGPGTNAVQQNMNPDLYDLNTLKYPGDKPLVDAFIDTVRDASFSFYSFVTPVAYEPNSNTLFQVQNYRYMPQGGTALHGSIYVKYSQNYGQTWSKKIFWDVVSQIPVFPSIAVTNPENKTNPLDFNYVISGPVAIEQGGTYPWSGAFWLLVNGQSSTDPLNYQGPIPGQNWWTTRAAANVVDGEEVFYNVGTLSNQTGYNYGFYGNSAFNMTVGDFNAQNSPAQWDPTKFRPSTDPNSSYNDYLYVDVDDQGGTYVGVKNMFADDIDNRVPAVSKSTDGGVTWADFDRMPASLLTNYYQVFGGDPSSSFMIPYSSDGFVVWGVDSWSFLFRVVINKGADEYEFHITEAYKTNGTWQMRKVGDWSGFNQLAMREVGMDAAWKDSLVVSRLGNELQIVKTADKQHLIAKWVDYIDDTLQVNPPILLGGTDTLAVINSNDVFMAVRKLTETTWGEAKNVTDDKFIDKCTYLPLTVPNLENVPLFQMSTFMSSYTDPNNPRNHYPANGWVLIVDTWQGLGFSNINLTGVVSVDEESYNFSVNEVYPNPATDAVEFTFSLNNAGNVNIEIYNSLGQKVSSVINTVMSAGLHGLNIDVSSFVNGTYYIRLTNNGNSVTKTLNVIR